MKPDEKPDEFGGMPDIAYVMSNNDGDVWPVVLEILHTLSDLTYIQFDTRFRGDWDSMEYVVRPILQNRPPNLQTISVFPWQDEDDKNYKRSHFMDGIEIVQIIDE